MLYFAGFSDQIFLLNQELECQDSYLWNSTDANFFDCTQAGIEVLLHIHVHGFSILLVHGMIHDCTEHHFCKYMYQQSRHSLTLVIIVYSHT